MCWMITPTWIRFTLRCFYFVFDHRATSIFGALIFLISGCDFQNSDAIISKYFCFYFVESYLLTIVARLRRYEFVTSTLQQLGKLDNYTLKVIIMLPF